MLIVQRIRLSPVKDIAFIDEDEIIKPPDIEMWGIYDSTSGRILSLHLTMEEAVALKNTLSSNWRNKNDARIR